MAAALLPPQLRSLIGPISRQPTSEFDIDWDNKDTEGLVSLLWMGAGGPIDLLNRKEQLSTSGATIGITARGVGRIISTAGTNGVYSARQGFVNAQPSTTTMTMVYVGELGTSGSSAVSVGHTDGGAGYFLGCQFGSRGRWVKAAGATLSSGTWSVGQGVFALVADGSNLIGYDNGVEFARTAATAALSYSTFCRYGLGGNPDTTGTTASGLFIAVFNRGLSPKRISALSRNPWRLFKDPVSREFLMLPQAAASTLAANMADVATQTASLSTQIPLASAALGVSTMTAAANSAITPSAAMVDVSTQTGALSTVISISATELSQALMNAGLATNITPAAAMQDTATMQATLGSGAATLAAIMAAQAIQQANLSSQITAGAAMSDTATMGATLTVQAAFSAAMVAQSLMQSGLLTQIQAAAAMADNASMSASLSGAAATLSSAMTALSAMQGSLQTSIPVSAAMLSQALMQGGLTVSIPLAAMMGDTSTLTATLSTGIRAAANMQDTTTMQAALVVQPLYLGPVHMQAHSTPLTRLRAQAQLLTTLRGGMGLVH